MQKLRKVIYIIAFGYICYFFSERVFWSFFRPAPEDFFGNFLMTWFVYSLLGYVALGLIWKYRVTDWRGIFLVGALYGWIAEGVVVTTMYGTTMGMWATISFTGLAWHALFTGLFGWLFLGRALRGSISFAHYCYWLTGAGMLWGLWALNWGFEGAGWDVSASAFALHTLAYAVPLPFAYLMLSKLRDVPMELSRIEWRVLWVLFGALYIFWNMTTGIFPLSLAFPALLALTLHALKKLRTTEEISVEQALWGVEPLLAWRVAALMLMPINAIIVYTITHEYFGAVHTNWPVFLIAMPLGYLLYAYVVWRACYPSRTGITT